MLQQLREHFRDAQRLRRVLEVASREVAAVLALFTVAVCAWVFLESVDEVVEGETEGMDRRILLALRRGGGGHEPIGPRWLEMAAADVTALGSTTVLVLVVAFVVGLFAARPAWSRQGFDAFDVIEKLGDCVAPAFAKRLGRGLHEALHAVDPNFVPPSTTIGRYLDWLADAGVLTHDGYGYKVSYAEAQELARLRQRREVAAARRRRLIERVNAIVGQLPTDEATAFDLQRWMGSPLPGFDTSAEGLIEADDQVWWTFEARLDRIASMQAGWSWTEEFLNLPLKGELERAKSREQARQAAAAERKRQELEAAANGRILVATAHAERIFGGDAAAAWLHRPSRTSTVSPVDAARASPDGLAKVLRALERIEAERREQLARGTG